MQPMAGDIIYADRGTYNHYGIYVDKNTVIHYATDDDSSDSENAYVHITTPKKFANGDDVYRLNFPKTEDEWEEIGKKVYNVDSSIISFSGIAHMEGNPLNDLVKGLKWLGDVIFGHGDDDNPRLFSPQETIERAKSRLGEREYNLIFNNCEHFAIWCKTGISESTQVDKIIAILTAIPRYTQMINW